MMRAAWYESKGPAAAVLHVGSIERPTPARSEVLVKVHASGVNPTDVKNRAGTRGRLQMPFPRIIPHHDGAGVIVEVGEQIDRSRIGERVWFFEAQVERPFGSAAEYVAIPSHQAALLPEATSFSEGACLGVPAMTAHRCVFADGPVFGQTVLVTGGAGAVGFYAVQMAKLGGAQVIATVSRPAQAERARAAGADLVINRMDEDVVRIAREKASGVDRIVDVAFGANIDTSLQLLKTDGVIATYASDAVPEPPLPFWPLVARNATIQFVFVFAMSEHAHDLAKADLERWLGQGQLIHEVGARYDLDAIVQAHEAVESGQLVGKAVIAF